MIARVALIAIIVRFSNTLVVTTHIIANFFSTLIVAQRSFDETVRAASS
jgi:hypothetical protein